MNKSLSLIELNEVSMDYVNKYIAIGELPNFKKFLLKNKLIKTHSEKEYHLIEPWIQWVTVHTGLKFDEHKIYRLGDGINHEENIWNKLEKKGVNSILISPMNSVNPNLKNSIYVPDPWNSSGVQGGISLKILHKSISSIVNNNANNKFKASDLLLFFLSFLRFARLKNYHIYFRLSLNFLSKKWNKALFLDLLLADVFISSFDDAKYKFYSVFLNASAHIQHHYFHSSKVYNGKKNPEWYCSDGRDPLLDAYRIYDHILGDIIQNHKNSRLIIATGLSQEPTDNPTYYWRLKNHYQFIKKLDIKSFKVEPRMSRDFLLILDNGTEAKLAEDKFLKLTINNEEIFDVDNRGSTLFITLKFPNVISDKSILHFEGRIFLENFFNSVSLVALKNGQHNEVGYFIDTAYDENTDSISLKDVHKKILENF